MISRIRKLGDPVLKIPTQLIDRFDNSLLVLADRMFEAMYKNDGVGLAANQIGISKSIFVYDDREGNKGIVCNPTISFCTDGDCMNSVMEGCLSIPGFFSLTPRAMEVTLMGEDAEGKSIEMKNVKGLLAQIFQHELDHLLGQLFISYLPKETQAGVILGNQVMR